MKNYKIKGMLRYLFNRVDELGNICTRNWVLKSRNFVNLENIKMFRIFNISEKFMNFL